MLIAESRAQPNTALRFTKRSIFFGEAVGSTGPFNVLQDKLLSWLLGHGVAVNQSTAGAQRTLV